jgi:hypothetical protein
MMVKLVRYGQTVLGLILRLVRGEWFVALLLDEAIY